jgi:hypothetical protein
MPRTLHARARPVAVVVARFLSRLIPSLQPLLAQNRS